MLRQQDAKQDPVPKQQWTLCGSDALWELPEDTQKYSLVKETDNYIKIRFPAVVGLQKLPGS